MIENSSSTADPLAPAIEALQNGRTDAAVALLLKWLAKKPNHPQILNLLGVARRRQGRTSEAIAHLEAAAKIAPRPDILNNFANALLDNGDVDRAITNIQTALSQQPDYYDAQLNLARAFHRTGNHTNAHTAALRAAELNPQAIEALILLAELERAQGRNEDAFKTIERALKRQPNNAVAHRAKATLLRLLGRRAEAIQILKILLQADPRDLESTLTLARLLGETGKTDDALALLKQSSELRPDAADLYGEQGKIELMRGQWTEAEKNFRRTIDLQPNHVDAHCGLAQILLTRGELREGFSEFQWTYTQPETAKQIAALGKPIWQGEPLAQKHLVILCGTSFSNPLQMARYFPSLATQDARITVITPAPLVSLFETSFAKYGITVTTTPTLPPDTDFICPIMALPYRFQTELVTIPTPIPYFFVTDDRLQHWQEEITRRTLPDTIRIGLIWQGNPASRRDRTRSPGLDPLLRLFQVPGLSIFSLQTGIARYALTDRIFPSHVHELGGEIRDFTDTAAIMKNLDLVISPCTAPAHLAGALGCPVWVLLEQRAEWRWLIDRQDSPWYPKAKLFRQTLNADWFTLADQVAQALSQEAKHSPMTIIA